MAYASTYELIEVGPGQWLFRGSYSDVADGDEIELDPRHATKGNAAYPADGSLMRIRRVKVRKTSGTGTVFSTAIRRRTASGNPDTEIELQVDDTASPSFVDVQPAPAVDAWFPYADGTMVLLPNPDAGADNDGTFEVFLMEGWAE